MSRAFKNKNNFNKSKKKTKKDLKTYFHIILEMSQAPQYFQISKKASKNSQKVYDIEQEYDDMLPTFIYKVCSRCKKQKHIDYYGTDAYTGEPRKVCDACVEYNKQYRLNRT